MKLSPNLYGRINRSEGLVQLQPKLYQKSPSTIQSRLKLNKAFWCFLWFPENSLLCVILLYTVYVRTRGHWYPPRTKVILGCVSWLLCCYSYNSTRVSRIYCIAFKRTLPRSLSFNFDGPQLTLPSQVLQRANLRVAKAKLKDPYLSAHDFWHSLVWNFQLINWICSLQKIQFKVGKKSSWSNSTMSKINCR